MKLYLLNLGRFAGDQGRILTPGRDAGVWRQFPVPAYLIETDDGRRILVDTGMHRKHIRNPEATFRGRPISQFITPIMSEADDIEHRLGEIGYSPADIDIVVSTHFHFDHAGNNADFSGARFVAQRDAHAHARANPTLFPPDIWDFPDLDYELIDGNVDLVPGVTLLSTPGHVPGHMSVVVRLPRAGTMVLAIDAIPLREVYDHDDWSGQLDQEQARMSGHLLTEIALRERGVLIPGHDPKVWAALKRSPEYYD